jgi:YegS/Rv2252/BmrU family lipid kinase
LQPRKNIYIIRNPASGGKDKLFKACLQELESLDIRCQVVCTEAPGHGQALAREVARDTDVHTVVAAGGDGTINEVANGLLDSTKPLGIIPVGTANVLAKEMGLAIQANAIARTIAFGEERKIYPGIIDGKAFLLMVGVGFDAACVWSCSHQLKKYLGEGAYFLSGVKEFLNFSSPRLEISTRGKTYEANWIIASKGRLYAGEFLLSPTADLEEPEFVVSLFKIENRWQLFRSLVGIGLGRKKWPERETFTVREFSVAGKAPVQVDGDCAENLPLTASISADPLYLIYPCEGMEGAPIYKFKPEYESRVSLAGRRVSGCG